MNDFQKMIPLPIRYEWLGTLVKFFFPKLYEKYEAVEKAVKNIQVIQGEVDFSWEFLEEYTQGLANCFLCHYLDSEGRKVGLGNVVNLYCSALGKNLIEPAVDDGHSQMNLFDWGVNSARPRMGRSGFTLNTANESWLKKALVRKEYEGFSTLLAVRTLLIAWWISGCPKQFEVPEEALTRAGSILMVNVKLLREANAKDN